MIDNSIIFPGEANCIDLHEIEYFPFNLILVFKLMSLQIEIFKMLNVSGSNLVISKIFCNIRNFCMFLKYWMKGFDLQIEY